MSEGPTTTRRRLLGTTGGLAALGLAGCLGYSGAAGGGGDADGSVDTPRPTPTPQPTETEGHHEGESDHHEEGESAHEEGGHGSEGPADHVVVEMLTNDSGHHFHPHVAWVKPGGTVTFENTSGSHTATAYHPDNDRPLRIPEEAEPFDSGLLTASGETFEHTFEVEGVYDVYCAPHESLGMIGTVLVGEPDPHGQPGLSEPQEALSEGASRKLSELNHQVDETLGHTHADGTPTETDHHDDGAGDHSDEEGHHDGTPTEHHDEDSHHDGTPTEHHDEDGHHEGTETTHSH